MFIVYDTALLVEIDGTLHAFGWLVRSGLRLLALWSVRF